MHVFRLLMFSATALTLAACQTTQQSNGCQSRSPLTQLADILRSADPNAPARPGPQSIDGYFSDCIVYDFLTADEQVAVHNVAVERMDALPSDGHENVSWENADKSRSATIEILPSAPVRISSDWVELANARGGAFADGAACRPVITTVTRQQQNASTALVYCNSIELGWVPVGEVDPAIKDSYE